MLRLQIRPFLQTLCSAGGRDEQLFLRKSCVKSYLGGHSSCENGLWRRGEEGGDVLQPRVEAVLLLLSVALLQLDFFRCVVTAAEVGVGAGEAVVSLGEGGIERDGFFKGRGALLPLGLFLIEHAELVPGVGKRGVGRDSLLQERAGPGVVAFLRRLMEKGGGSIGGGLGVAGMLIRKVLQVFATSGSGI